jgi:hypothetical protein
LLKKGKKNQKSKENICILKLKSKKIEFREEKQLGQNIVDLKV